LPPLSAPVQRQRAEEHADRRKPFS
jgi:hypothetical protein